MGKRRRRSAAGRWAGWGRIRPAHRPFRSAAAGNALLPGERQRAGRIAIEADGFGVRGCRGEYGRHCHAGLLHVRSFSGCGRIQSRTWRRDRLSDTGSLPAPPWCCEASLAPFRGRLQAARPVGLGMRRRAILYALLSAALFGASTPLAKALLRRSRAAGARRAALPRQRCRPGGVATRAPRAECSRPAGAPADWPWLAAAIAARRDRRAGAADVRLVAHRRLDRIAAAQSRGGVHRADRLDCISRECRPPDFPRHGRDSRRRHDPVVGGAPPAAAFPERCS